MHSLSLCLGTSRWKVVLRTSSSVLHMGARQQSATTWIPRTLGQLATSAGMQSHVGAPMLSVQLMMPRMQMKCTQNSVWVSWETEVSLQPLKEKEREMWLTLTVRILARKPSKFWVLKWFHQLKAVDRAEVVCWVSESLWPFLIIKDRSFKLLMKTGRPNYYLPSRSTVPWDICLVFAHMRNHIAKMLQVSSDTYHGEETLRDIPGTQQKNKFHHRCVDVI